MYSQNTPTTFYWYDYEIFGVNARKSRPAQFAGRRTDFDLNPIQGEEGEVLYCQPPRDQLPAPEKCLQTGITPQLCEERGLKETEFAGEIWERLNVPATVSIGYNSLVVDDEVNRFLFWRNFLEPYTHGYANGCSRWDLFPLVCACWALRGESIRWPQREDIDPAEYPPAAGRTGVCFKLEYLAEANGIEVREHDPLGKVEAMIGIMRLLKEREPRLLQWAFENRTTSKVLAAVSGMRPVVWVSPRFGSARGCTGIVASFYQNKNDCWMWDLTEDPTELSKLTAEELSRRLFPSREDRLAGVQKLPVLNLKANASPFVCGSLKVLSPARAAKYGINLGVIEENRRKLHEIAPLVQSTFAEMLEARFVDEEQGEEKDTDTSLYSSAFPSINDKAWFRKIRAATPEELKVLAESGQIHFDDPQFTEMLLRYRARNYPETLSEADREHWHGLCRRRLFEGADGSLTIFRFQDLMDEAMGSGKYDDDAHQEIIGALYEWGEMMGAPDEMEAPF